MQTMFCIWSFLRENAINQGRASIEHRDRHRNLEATQEITQNVKPYWTQNYLHHKLKLSSSLYNPSNLVISELRTRLITPHTPSICECEPHAFTSTSLWRMRNCDLSRIQTSGRVNSKFIRQASLSFRDRRCKFTFCALRTHFRRSFKVFWVSIVFRTKIYTPGLSNLAILVR